MEQVWVKILRDTRSGGKRVAAGEVLRVDLREARKLIGAGKADVTTAPKSKSVEAPKVDAGKKAKKGARE